jgi:hypothetical protein
VLQKIPSLNIESVGDLIQKQNICPVQTANGKWAAKLLLILDL